MANLFLDFSVLLPVLVIVAAVLHGWGAIAWCLLGSRMPTGVSTKTVWLGFCAVLGFLELVHLVVQIDWRMSLLTMVVGLLGNWPSLRDRKLQTIVFTWRSALRAHLILAACCILIFCFWCLRAMEVPTMYDSGLYHFSSIRWLNESPIVPGLGNLHWRLALNQSYFGFLALLNVAPYWNKGYAAGGLFLLILTAFTLIDSTTRTPKGMRYVYAGLILFYLCQIAGLLANPTPDLAVSVLEIVIFLYAVELLTQQTNDQEHDHKTVVLILWLCFALVSIKLSGIAFAGTSAVIIFFYYIYNRSKSIINLLPVTLLLVTLSVVHIGRSVLLSGAPFFPSSVAGFWTLPWAVPVSFAQVEAELIYLWARSPGTATLPAEAAAPIEWIAEWFKRLPSAWLMTFSLATALTIVNTACLVARPFRTHVQSMYLLYIPILSSFIFWFCTAPDIRFLGAVNVLYLALATGLGMQNLSTYLDAKGINVAAQTTARFRPIGFGLAGLIFVVVMLRWVSVQPISLAGWPLVPSPNTHIEQTASGLQVHVPTVGAECWDAPLPCASVVYGSLHKEPWIVPFGASRLVEHRYILSIK
jgi:hypothetical protein